MKKGTDVFHTYFSMLSSDASSIWTMVETYSSITGEIRRKLFPTQSCIPKLYVEKSQVGSKAVNQEPTAVFTMESLHLRAGKS